MLCVAIGTYLSVYPFFLLLPILLLLENAKAPQVLTPVSVAWLTY